MTKSSNTLTLIQAQTMPLSGSFSTFLENQKWVYVSRILSAGGGGHCMTDDPNQGDILYEERTEKLSHSGEIHP